MTYEIEPKVVRLIPFQSEGGALAAADVAFGPIVVSAKLYQTGSGYFLSLPSRHSEAKDKWYEQVSISDLGLKLKAQARVVSEYERLSKGEVIAV
jgi:DNA-binding cell septation regulator SpoVG